jgi:hypothetical protein
MKTHSKIHIGIIALAFLFLIIAFTVLPKVFAAHVNIGSNYRNVTIWTYVNITHSKPDVINVTIYEAQNYSARNITVNAGGMKEVYCNATVRSWEGFNDITNVNATLYHITSNTSAPDDNNSHYTNVSCTINSSHAPANNFTGTYVCGFNIVHYSNNGTWICNVTVSNSYTIVNPNFTGNNYGTTLFYPVYALNITDGIDYGGVAVEDYSSPDRTANITNLGNMRMNITVEGYGATRGDGLAMNCSLAGNITVDNERFSAAPGVTLDAKTNLTSTAGGVMIPGLTIAKQINSTIITNVTYWQLYVPPNPAGNCTGNIIFTGVAS